MLSVVYISSLITDDDCDIDVKHQATTKAKVRTIKLVCVVFFGKNVSYLQFSSYSFVLVEILKCVLILIRQLTMQNNLRVLDPNTAFNTEPWLKSKYKL